MPNGQWAVKNGLYDRDFSNENFETKNNTYRICEPEKVFVDQIEYPTRRMDRNKVPEKRKLFSAEKIRALKVAGAFSIALLVGTGYMGFVHASQEQSFENATTVVYEEVVHIGNLEYGLEVYKNGDAAWVDLENGEKFATVVTGGEYIEASDYARVNGYTETYTDTQSHVKK